ncbi:MAG: hypothetical protein ABIJ09_24845 [Pseudomonadota bacterium]
MTMRHPPFSWTVLLRTGGSLALLAAAALLSLASNLDSSAEKYNACCACLSRSHNDYSEPCVSVSTSQCVDTISSGQPVASNSRCLRDLCEGDCGEVVGQVTALADIEECCACLVASRDPSGVACVQVDAVTCAKDLDNGHSLASTQACFDDVCRGRCGFLNVQGIADAGPADGG